MNSIKSIYQIIALTLSFLMLITSIGFTIDMHFCRGHLQSISFFGKAKKCCEISEASRMEKCPHYKKMMEQIGKCSMNEKGNCENKTLYFQFDQNQQIQISDFSLTKRLKQFIKAYSLIFFLDNFSFENDLPSFIHYKPPLILRDIHVLIQSFLL